MEEVCVIDRPLYTGKLLRQVDNNLIKILTGQRRVGKSYILKYICQAIREKRQDANIIRINLEDFAFSHIKDVRTLND